MGRSGTDDLNKIGANLVGGRTSVSEAKWSPAKFFAALLFTFICFLFNVRAFGD